MSEKQNPKESQFKKKWWSFLSGKKNSGSSN